MANNNTVNITVTLDNSQASQGIQQITVGLQNLGQTSQQASNLFGQSFSQIAQAAGLAGAAFGVTMNVAQALVDGIKSLASAAIDAADQIGQIKNALSAVTGSIDAGTQKFNELVKVVQDTKGVTLDLASAVTVRLTAMNAVSTANIEGMVKSLGSLKNAFGDINPDQLIQSLARFYSRLDVRSITQLTRQIPNFGQILLDGLGTNDPATLKKLRDSGKLSFDQFIGGINDGVAANPVLGQLDETISGFFGRMWSRVKTALAPAGQELFDWLKPLVEDAVQAIEAFGRAFENDKPMIEGLLEPLGDLVKLVEWILLNPIKSLFQLGQDDRDFINFFIAAWKDAKALATGQFSVKDFFTGKGMTPGEQYLAQANGQTQRVLNENNVDWNKPVQYDAQGNLIGGTMLDPNSQQGKLGYYPSGFGPSGRQAKPKSPTQDEIAAAIEGGSFSPGYQSAAAQYERTRERNSAMIALDKWSSEHGLPTPDMTGMTLEQIKTTQSDLQSQFKEQDSGAMISEMMKQTNAVAKEYGYKPGQTIYTADQLTAQVGGSLPGAMTDQQAAETLLRVKSGKDDYQNTLSNIDQMLQGGQLQPGDADKLRAQAAGQYAQEIRGVIQQLDDAGKLHDKEKVQLTQEADQYERIYQATAKLGTDGAGFMEGFNSQIKTTRDMVKDLGTNIANAFNDLPNIFTNLSGALKSFLNAIAGNVIQRALSPVLGGLFGVGQLTGAPGNGLFGSGGGGGTPAPVASALQLGGSSYDPYSAFAGLTASAGGLSEGMGGLVLDPTGQFYVPQGTYSQAGVYQQAQQAQGDTIVLSSGTTAQKPNPAATQSVGFLSNLKNLVNSPLLMAGLGGSLGYQMIGGNSTVGHLLGAGAGIAGGLLASSAATIIGSQGIGGLFSGLGLLTLGPLAGIGAILGIGGMLLGNAQQRKTDEQQSGVWLTQAEQALDQLGQQINSDQTVFTSRDQAQQYFNDNILIPFEQNIQTLKTKSVVDSRMKNQTRDLQNIFNSNIAPAVDAQIARAASAAATQQSRGLLDSRLVPEFATGGMVPGQFGARVPAYLHAGEVVLNQQQIQQIGANTLADAGVPGVRGGGSGSSGGDQPIHVTFVMGTDTADQIYTSGVSSRTTSGATASALKRVLQYGG